MKCRECGIKINDMEEVKPHKYKCDYCSELRLFKYYEI